MENTQLSFLTSLLGGKSSSEALSGANTFLTDDSELPDGAEFLSLVDGLLIAQTAGEALQSPFLAEGSFLPQASLIADGAQMLNEPFTETPSALFSETKELAGLFLGAAASGETTRANTDSVATEMKSSLINVQQSAVPVAAGVNKTIRAELPSNMASALAAGGAVETGLAKNEAVDGEIADSAIELALEARAHEKTSRFDGLDMRQPGKPTSFVNSGPANALTAINENAALEAQNHSALTRTDESAEIERLSIIKTDAGVSLADRMAHINPVRDQIVAAVVARNGENRLEVRLDPPELGRVMIGFEGEGTDFVRAVISADSPETLELMRRNLDVFQRALEAQGFANLDLHFAEHGQRDGAEKLSDDPVARLSEAADESDLLQSDAPGKHIALGRLDRRL